MPAAAADSSRAARSPAWGAAPGCRVIGVEPELGDDATRSFRRRRCRPSTTPRPSPTDPDPVVGTWTFPLVLEHVADMVTVSEKAIVDAVRFLFLRLKLVVEPSGALGVAALLSGAYKPKGRSASSERRQHRSRDDGDDPDAEVRIGITQTPSPNPLPASGRGDLPGSVRFQPPTCTRQTPTPHLIPASGKRGSSGVVPTFNLRLARVRR